MANKNYPASPLIAAAFCCAIGVTATSGATAARKSYDVPGGDAAATLAQFARHSGCQIVYLIENVRGEKTQPVRGEYAALDALRVMLGGTALFAVQDESTGALVVSRKRSSPAQKEKEESGRSRGPPSAAPVPPPDPPKTAQPYHKESPPVKKRNLFSFLAGWLLAGPALDAQPSTATPNQQPVVLDPFTVSTAQDRGYRAANSITATGIGTAIKDVPVNISVLTEENLSDRGVFDLRDAVKNLASVIGGNRSDETDAIKVRGNQAVIEQDGVVGGLSPLFDVNRIEVVRGPSSIFHGASRPGGVVNIISNVVDPAKWRSDAEYQAGSLGLSRGAVSVNVPIIRDRLAFRIYAAHYERDGQYDYQTRDENFLRGALFAVPFKSKVVKLSASFQHYDREWHVMQAEPVTHPAFVAAVNAGTVAPLTTARAWLDSNPLYGPNTPQGVIFARPYVLPKADYNPDGRIDIKHGDTQSYGVTVQPLDWLSLQARGTYASGSTDLVEFNLFRPQAGFRPGQFVYRINSTWAHSRGRRQDYRLEGTARFKLLTSQHRVLFGSSRTLAGSDSQTLNGPTVTFDPMVDPIPDHRAVITARNPGWFRDVSVFRYGITRNFYATDQITLFGDRLRLLAGARNSNVTLTNGKITRATTPQYGALFKITQDFTVYANYGKVFEPNNLRDGLGRPVPPVTGNGGEAGFKADFGDGRVSFTTSVYTTDRMNVARVDFSKQAETGIIPYYVLGGLERNQGFEFETVLSPADNYQIMLSYAWSWTHKTLENTGDPKQVGIAIDGVPDHQLTLWSIYSFRQPGLRGLSIGGGVKWVQQIDRLHPNWDIAIGEDGYTKADLFVRYGTKIFGHSATLQVNIDNLTNEKFYDHVFIRAEPRLFSASVKIRF